MEPARSVDHSEDRDLIAGLAIVWTGLRNSRIETRMAPIPDTDREPTEPALLDECGFSIAAEGEITRSRTTTIHEHRGLVDQHTPTRIDHLQNHRPSRHTELRRENARLRMERELLKRAVAFWVRESNE